MRVGETLVDYTRVERPNAALERVLTALGVPSDRFSAVFGTAVEGERVTAIAAYRFRGADPRELARAFVDAGGAGSDPSGATDASAGDKPVILLADADSPLRTYVYARDDVVFTVRTADADVAAEVLAGLP